MPAPSNSALREALAAYGTNLGTLLAGDQDSESALGRALKKRGLKVSTKTINNIRKGRHPSQLGKLTAIAEYFGVPLWIMFIPDLPKDMLQKDKADRLQKLLKDYLACSEAERVHPESIAAAYAGKGKHHEK